MIISWHRCNHCTWPSPHEAWTPTPSPEICSYQPLGPVDGPSWAAGDRSTGVETQKTARTWQRAPTTWSPHVPCSLSDRLSAQPQSLRREPLSQNPNNSPSPWNSTECNLWDVWCSNRPDCEMLQARVTVSCIAILWLGSSEDGLAQAGTAIMQEMTRNVS